MGNANGGAGRGARCIALVGPYMSGKTTLLEAILHRTDTIPRQGTIEAGNTVGDSAAEARAHGMSTELNVANAEFIGDTFTFIDCPGSVELQSEADAVLTAVDAAIVVTEPDPKRVPALQVILKKLESRGIPHLLFLNKIDSFDTPVREILPMLQPASEKPLVLRQVPIWENGIATGFVDLALERAFVYREHAASEVIEMPGALTGREQSARFEMLEKLADYDDDLMEQLLSDITPPRDRVFDDLSRELREGLICPVFIGSATHGNGVGRLLKALRHEAPFVDVTASRLGVEGDGAVGYVMKTIYTSHGGKLSLTRILKGSIGEGDTVRSDNTEERVAGVATLAGADARKRGAAQAGETVALARLDKTKTGDTITTGSTAVPQIARPEPPPAVMGVAISLKDRKDEVKLTTALAKAIEEDFSLNLEHVLDTHQMVLWGQGEMHLRVALERLKRKSGIEAETQRRQIPYRETIRSATTIRGRHKKQSGGHGQFGDVVLDIAPLPRGAGFRFDEKIHGGVVPKQFIPSVEIGVEDYLQHGPLGFPVVDVAVTLTDGSYHTVDSSDMAFRQAGRLAMSEGMPKCGPVLLEPIMRVSIAVPTDATSRINAMIPQRRGQILGFDAREGWPGWDVVEAKMPESEIQDLIVELRSATAGVGTFTSSFDHLAELTGRLADQILAEQKQAAE